MIGYLITGSSLLLCSIHDLRRKSISNQVLLLCGMLTAIAILIFPGNVSFLSRAAGVAAGGAMVLLSKAVRGQFGSGDGFTIMLIGLGIGFRDLLILLCGAFLLAGIFSAGLLIKGKNRHYQFPFIPFLFTAFLFITVIKIMNIL